MPPPALASCSATGLYSRAACARGSALHERARVCEWVWMPSEGHQGFITSKETFKRRWSQNTRRPRSWGTRQARETERDGVYTVVAPTGDRRRRPLSGAIGGRPSGGRPSGTASASGGMLGERRALRGSWAQSTPLSIMLVASAPSVRIHAPAMDGSSVQWGEWASTARLAMLS